MSDIDPFSSIRVVPRPKARELCGLSDRTWDRMEARGETPPKTDLSPGRVGYRVVDIEKWLDARRRVAS
jgi:predicted DNA-binding transcriptional regulator AlpA